MKNLDGYLLARVRRELHHVKGTGSDALTQAAVAWYQQADQETQTVVERQCAEIIQAYEQCSEGRGKTMFGSLGALELLCASIAYTQGWRRLGDGSCSWISDG